MLVEKIVYQELLIDLVFQNQLLLLAEIKL